MVCMMSPPGSYLREGVIFSKPVPGRAGGVNRERELFKGELFEEIRFV